MIPIGKRRHLVEIEAPTETVTDGRTTTSWSSIGEQWVEIQEGEGREFWRASQVYAETSHLVRMLYDDRVTVRHRFSWGDRTLNVIGVQDPDGRTESLHVACKEAV